MTHNWNHKAEKYIPPGYLLHSHGKSPCSIGKPSISMGHLYHGELLVITRGYKHMIRSIFDRPNLEFKWTCIGKQTELLELFKGMDPNHKPWNGREIGYMMVIWWLYDGIITYYVYIYIYGWWCKNHLEKWWSESPWEGWHPIYEMDNNIHVWNHQAVFVGL